MTHEEANLMLEQAFEAAFAEDETVTFQHTVKNPGSYLESELAEWLKGERKAGEVTVIETAEGYYVAQFFSRGRDTEVPADIRHILVAAEQDEGATMPTDAQFDAAKAEAEALLKSWEEGAKTEDSFAEQTLLKFYPKKDYHRIYLCKLIRAWTQND